MTFTGRFTLVVALVSSGLIGFTGTAIADAPTSSYRVTTVSAGAFFFDSEPPYDQADVFVTDTITFARVGASSGGTSVIEVDASWSGPDSSGNGCSILGNSNDFAFSSDLSTASLHTTFTQDLTACNEFQPLVPDVTVDASWAGPPATSGGTSITRYACGGFTTEDLTKTSGSVVDAHFSFSALAVGFEDNQANLGLSDQSVHAQGVLPNTCIGPGQKGVGIGPHPPGRYVLSSRSADFNSTDQTVNLGVRTSTFAANPNGQGSATSSETDLFANVNGFFGCFVLSPADASISSDLSAATLHTTLDQNTPQCGFGYFPFLPLSVDMTLTQAGPTATTQTVSPMGCFAIFFVDKATHAGGSATLGFHQPDGSVVSVGYTAASSSELDSSDHTFRLSGSTRCTPG